MFFSSTTKQHQNFLKHWSQPRSVLFLCEKIKKSKSPFCAGFGGSRYCPTPPTHAGRETRVSSHIFWKNFRACFACFGRKHKKQATKGECGRNLHAWKIFVSFLAEKIGQCGTAVEKEQKEIRRKINKIKEKGPEGIFSNFWTLRDSKNKNLW